MTKGNKDAKRLRDTHGVSYMTALRLIRELGLEGAIAQCERWNREAEELLEQIDKEGE